MKYFHILLLFVFYIGLSSCQEERISESIENENDFGDAEYRKGNVYPLSLAYRDWKLETRSESVFESDWENCSAITLGSGASVKLPWNSISDSNVPYDIAADIRKKDGWQLVFHTLVPSEGASPDRNYMIFHNLRTGILKVYYYKENDVSNNTCIWFLLFQYPQQWMNCVDELCHPLSFGQCNVIETSTFSTYSDKGIRKGWNCFQVLLTYAPNATQVMDINAQTLNVGELDLFGQYEEASSGTLLSYSSRNPLSKFTGEIANISGNYAANWLKKEIDEGKIKENSPQTRGWISSLVIGSVKSLVKGGVNKILNAFTGRFSKTVTNRMDIQINTQGNSRTTGTLSFVAPAPILSLRTDFSHDRIGALGAWNLAAQPIIYLSPIADHQPSSYDNLYHQYSYKFRGIKGYKYELLFNPALKSHLLKYWTEMEVVHYKGKMPQIPVVYTDFGVLGGSNSFLTGYFENLLYENSADSIAIYEDHFDPHIYTTYDMYQQYGRPLKAAFIPKTETMEGTYRFDKNHFVKFTLFMVTNFEGQIDTTVSTRTFVPKIEWDPYLYNKYKDMDGEWIEYQETR